MVSNVFGNPITNDTLKDLPEYQGKTITRLDRAKAAIRMKNYDNKNKHARDYVRHLKSEWGTGVSTLIEIYNATGSTITLVSHRDWNGHIGPCSYPTEIKNGQWGCFLHVKTSGAASGSCGGIIYKGEMSNGEVVYWLVGWSNPWSRISHNNTVATRIVHHNYEKTLDNHYDNLHEKLGNDGGGEDTRRHLGCQSDVETESGTTAIVQAVFTLYS